jgi:23S rRNA (uracil1939-C5)-methyltransferase
MRYIARVRKGVKLTLTCTALDGDGAGVGMFEGVRVHVQGALPDERVRATVVHRSPHRPDAWASLDAIDSPSAARIPPVCPAYGQCGGCVLEHLAYEKQLTWKWERLANETTGTPELEKVPVGPCVPSPRPLGYRNRAKLVYARKGSELVLGAYAPRSHDVVDLAGCKIGEEPVDLCAGALLVTLEAHDVPPWDEQLAEGLLRYVVLRSNHLGEVLVTLVTGARIWPDAEVVARALMAASPHVVGVVQNVNESRGNAIYGPSDVPLAGRSFLDDRVGTVHVRLSPTAFFQVNRDVAAQLYADVLAACALTGTERVIDCYSGVGGVALTLASRAAEAIGIEENASAVDDALASVQLNHATRTRFIVGDVAERLAAIDAADVIVLNPPRRGCQASVLAQVARLKPRVIAYVSCAPDTLVRDLRVLAASGFLTRSIRPYDMMPQTPHVEALAVLTPA